VILSRQQAEGSRQQAAGRGPLLAPPCASVSSVVKKGIRDWGLGIREEKPLFASSRLCVEKNRRGLTLVELLVVVSIMMILVAFALPRLRPATGQRRVREAARMVNVFLARARVQAIETGRPCGVLFQRLDDPVIDELTEQMTASTLAPTDTMYPGCTTLSQVEVPPLYSGGSNASRVTVSGTALTPTDASDISKSIISPGDLIQLNHQGPWFQITGPLDALGQIDDIQGYLTIDLGGHTIPPYPSSVPFAILRRPTATIASPLRLPSGIVVDLGASGMVVDLSASGTNAHCVRSRPGAAAEGVTVMFSPDGSVSRYYAWDSAAGGDTPEEPLSFLIGQESQLDPEPESGVTGSDRLNYAVMPEATDEQKANWQLLTNLWITILPQSGLITVNENAATPVWHALPQANRENCLSQVGFAGGYIGAVNEAQQFAKQPSSMGGR